MIVLVLGTRPEIVKMAPVIRALAARGLPFGVVHTGQHYDDALDGVFFRDLELPPPDHNLGVGSGSRWRQVQSVREALGRWLRGRRVDALVVQGDTNSVLGAALAARDAAIPLAHVEAGLRCGDFGMAEERNRRRADRLAHWLFAPTALASEQLLREGAARDRVYQVGNTVVDELLRQRARAAARVPLPELGVERGGFALATVHRAETVAADDRLTAVVVGLRRVAEDRGLPMIVPLHPRTRRRIDALGLETGTLRLLPPLGYLVFLGLMDAAALVLSDSGGVQEEACVLGVPCVTLRDRTERPEAVSVGASQLVGTEPDRMLAAARSLLARPRSWESPFGDGKAGERIVDCLAGATRRA